METVSCPFTPPQSAMCQIALISDLIMAAGGNADVCAKFQIKNFQEHHFETLEEALVSVRFGSCSSYVCRSPWQSRPFCQKQKFQEPREPLSARHLLIQQNKTKKTDNNVTGKFQTMLPRVRLFQVFDMLSDFCERRSVH